MTQQFIEEYLQCFSKLDEASHAVEKCFNSIKKVHHELSRWESLQIAPDLNLKEDWPSLDTIASIVLAWNEANNEACKKWSKLSEEDRKGLKSPSERKGKICE